VHADLGAEIFAAEAERERVRVRGRRRRAVATDSPIIDDIGPLVEDDTS
jgi:hypothetical protein